MTAPTRERMGRGRDEAEIAGAAMVGEAMPSGAGGVGSTGGGMRRRSRNPSPNGPCNGGPLTFHGWSHSATDSKGHECKIPLRVQPAVARQIGLVAGSKQFPYRTPQELIRHAIYEHLKWLQTIGSR